MARSKAQSCSHQNPSGRARRFFLWVAAGLVLFIIGFGFTLVAGVNLCDESWFLQVLSRLSSGDILYRDVFFGITPLSVYLTYIPVRIFGVQILVIKAVASLCFSLTVLLCIHITRQLGQVRNRAFLLAGVLLVYAPPDALGTYQAFGNLFLLATFSATLAWAKEQMRTTCIETSRGILFLSMAGIAAGLCFLCKQNIGMYALAALMLSIITFAVNKPERNIKRLCTNLSIVAVWFLTVCIIFLLPVLLSGGFGLFTDYAFLNKGTYLRTADISYFDNLSQMVDFVRRRSLDPFIMFLKYTQFMLPPLVFGLLMTVWWKSHARERRRAEIVFFFVAGAFIGIFPRVDLGHFQYAVPELVIGLACCRLGIRLFASGAGAKLFKAALLLWLLVALSGETIIIYGRIGSGYYQVSSLPHFRGALFSSTQYAEIQSYRRALKASVADDELFLLIPEAGFYYLITGFKNPTPFDYPLVTAFGLTGEKQTAAAISAGRIHSVCMRYPVPSWMGRLQPQLLEDYVLREMKPKQDVGIGTVYCK